MKKHIFIVVSLFILILALVQSSFAQESKPLTPPQKSDPTTYREQRIYVPYKNLKEVLQKKDKGIFIPHSDFIKLWEEVTRKAPEKTLPPPPIDGAIVNAEYRGTINGDIAEFHGEIKIAALKEKWGRLLLNFEDIAITSLSLDGKTPLLKPVPQGFELVLPEKGNYTLEIDFSTKVETVPGERFIDFRVPSAPLTRIDMNIPGEDLDVQIKPMLSKKSNVAGGFTKFSAFLSPRGKVNVSWLAKSTEVKAANTLVFANLFSELHIKESLYTFNTRIEFSITQAKTDHFRIKIPKTLSLVRVDGKNIRDWEMGEDGILNVNLYEKIDGPYHLSVTTEKYRNFDETTFNYPQFAVLDAKREEGIIAIKSDPSLRVKVEKVEKATQIDPVEISGRTTKENLVSAYKYYRRPFLVRLSISKIRPKINAHQNILISFSETIIDYRTRVHYVVKDAGVFQFKLVLPDGFRVTEVGTERTVDSFSTTQENGRNILKIVLKNRAYGDYILPIHLEADKEDKNVSLDFPKLVCMGVEKEQGIIAISLRKNLKLSTEEIKSLRTISLKELKTMGIKNQDNSNVLVAGYRFAMADYSGILEIEKRKTKITAMVERNIDLGEAVIKLNDVIHYKILYAPISHFRLELPMSMGKDAVITGENIKEKRFVENGKEGTGLWLIELHAPRINRYTLSVGQEQKYHEVAAGEKRTIIVPPVRVLDVFNETGYISVSKSPDLQVDAEVENLEPIDSKDLPQGMDRNNSILSFKYLTHPYTLTLKSTKHEFEKVLDAIVNEAHFDIVISREGIAKTEGVFRIQNANRQSMEILMPEGTESIYSVFISGKKASISKGSSERSKIIMLGKNNNSGREMTLRMLYQSRVGMDFNAFGGFRVESAEIIEIPMSKITWRMYLPDQYSYLYMDGSMGPRSASYRALGLVNQSMSSQEVRSQNRIKINNQKILRQEDEKALYGLDMDIVREGRQYTLSKLDKNAFLNIRHIKKNVLFTVSLFLIAIVTLIFTTIPSKKKFNKFNFFVTSIIIVFFVRISVPQGFKYFALLLLLGIGLSGAIFVGLYFFKNTQPRRSGEKEIV